MTAADEPGPFTVVSFHAHPDDEVLLTGGTLAAMARQGHRVVIVFATAGESGLAAQRVGLGARRMEEARAAAAALGVRQVRWLGYADSGMRGEQGGEYAFCRCDPDAAAARLAEILREERAEVLTSYDAHGGYGHPDHRQVHQVAARAARLAGTPVLLEATAPRELLLRALNALRWLPRLPPGFAPDQHQHSFSPQHRITHEINVRGEAHRKRAAMAAHVSQRGGGGGARTLALLLRLPPPLFASLLGKEWFIETGRPVGARLQDPFASLRNSATRAGEAK